MTYWACACGRRYTHATTMVELSEVNEGPPKYFEPRATPVNPVSLRLSGLHAHKEGSRDCA